MADDIVTKTKTYTDKVRTAMYGKEVRSSIADSIDKIAENVKDEIARDELSKDVSSLNDDVTYLNGDLEKLLLKREKLKEKEKSLAMRVIRGEYYYPATNALWFYAPSSGSSCSSSWWDQEFAGRYKNHCFYKPDPGVCEELH